MPCFEEVTNLRFDRHIKWNHLKASGKVFGRLRRVCPNSSVPIRTRYLLGLLSCQLSLTEASDNNMLKVLSQRIQFYIRKRKYSLCEYL